MDFSHLKQIAFVGCTHGDEQLGRYIVNEFPFGKTDTLMYRTIIGNPDAMNLNVRGVEGDLNRSYPGDPQGNLEERRAAQILPFLQKYDVVIDFHQAFAHMPDLIIVKEWKEEIAAVADCFDMDHVLELDKGSGTYTGMMMSHVNNGIATEYGYAHNHKEACQRAKRDIENIIAGNRVKPNKKRYRIWGDLGLDLKGTVELENLVKLTDQQREKLQLTDENLYPIFIDGYDDKWCVLVQEL